MILMQPNRKLFDHISSPSTRGFALVVTLSLMILLTVIAVGLLSLSGISLRSSSQGEAAATARANARMALMLAIGELQKQTGPDTRVTATATIQDDTKPVVLGAWKSWEGTDHETSGASAGRPKAPDFASKMRLSTGPTDPNRFLGWLTSQGTLQDTLLDTKKEVTLVGKGTVGSGSGRDILQIHLEPTTMTIGTRKSALAWWIGGENQKARLPKPIPDAEKPTNLAEWTSLAKSHTVVDPRPLRMDALLTDPTPAAKAISLKQSDFIAPKKAGLAASQEFFHDLSATSIGLLTNTATGGWRKDFSLLSENWSAQPSSSLPFFQLTQGVNADFTRPSPTKPFPARSIFYPWSDYRNPTSDPGAPGWVLSGPIYRHGAVSSWENLMNWATLYKTMKSNGTGIDIQSSPYNTGTQINKNHHDFLHKVRIIPIIARVQWVFAYAAVPSTPVTNPLTYNPRLLITPVITLWNPYNVEIALPQNLQFLMEGLPNAFKFRLTSSGTDTDIPGLLTQLTSVTYSTNYTKPLTGSTGGDALKFRIDGSYPPLKPGETLLFSPTSFTPTLPAATNDWSKELVMKPGVRLDGGHLFPLRKTDGTEIKNVAGNVIMKTGEARFNAESKSTFNNMDYFGIKISLNMNFKNPGSSSPEPHLAYLSLYDSTIANAVYKPIQSINLGTAVVSQATSPVPFLTTIFGARSASNTYIPAKGFVQSSPLVDYTAMGSLAAGEWGLRYNYPGCAHPVNSPFDYDVQALSAAGSSLTPGSDSSNRGFIVTGFTSSDGLSRCVIAELPTKPVQSLAELQNWNLRNQNPIPPYAINIIGNSDASPLIPANAVFNSANASNGAKDLQHDDSYCANHLLFDDWFVSSIAPNSPSLGQPAATDTPKKAYQELVPGTTPLPNRAYKPTLSETAAEPSKIFDVTTTDSWKTVASRLEVEGMFNVNSTSVTAWRALLGHARSLKTAYLKPNGNTLSDEEDHAFSRFSVAGDTEAKSIGTSGAFSASSEFAGYRKLDATTLDRFAEEIVKQVRLRGPFLSLSEFVNRQLSSGDLALAGTIQSALNELQKVSSLNPYSAIETTLASSNPAPAGTSGYSFPDAAVGHSTYGLPGWTRQADVLRQIAPILSARDDTFVIRGYGDARDAANKITARATCEAVVRRTRDHVDPADAADITTLPTSPTNLIFGRRYEIVSFRWLNEAEI